MKTYQTIDGMWYEAVKSLMRAPAVESRDGACYEHLGWSGTLMDPTQSLLNCKERKLSHRYAAAELLWYFSGTDRGDLISKFAKSYERFLVDGRAEGAYGPRLFPTDEATSGALVDVIAELRRDRNSRRAFASVFRAEDLKLATRRKVVDLPCTVGLQFLIRDNKLHCIATMRSNDVWLGMPYDVFAFTQIQRLVASRLMVDVGWYVHQVGSLHLYERNAATADTITPTWGDAEKPFDLSWDVPYSEETRGGLDDENFLYMLGSEALGALEGSESAWSQSCSPAFNRLAAVARGQEETL
ncbi:pyrimidine hmase [Caudoviricetes sp.]|nr:pyrimidine hmase [Caudoviricetes sp.]UOF82729.1 pyrimidine hmase [Caudoviricetes sp.]